MANILETLRLRLDALVEADPKKPTAISREAGVSESAIREIVGGKTQNPGIVTIEKLAARLGVPTAALLGFVDVEGLEVPQPEPEFISIPRYGAELSAGGGAINTTEPVLDFIPFTADFLADRLGRDDVEGLVMVKAAGESMEPTITDGDLVMVDTTDQKHRAGIFAFLLSGESYVKRLEWIDQGVTIISDHPAYPARALSEDEAFVGDFELIGRVRWVGRTFL